MSTIRQVKMLEQNPLDEIRNGNGLVLTMSIVQARTPDIPMIVAAAGFDACCIDLEHSSITMDTASMLCTSALGYGVLPLVRVPSHDAHTMTRVLDAGALGVLVPHVENAAEARGVVEACRFPPRGHRSITGSNATTGYRPLGQEATIAEFDARCLMVTMVESPNAIANADEIAGVDGVDVLLVGVNDLCIELGIPGQFRDPRCWDALTAAAAAARAHDVIFGVAGLPEMDMLAGLLDLGLRYIGGAQDAALFRAAATAAATSLRTLDAAPFVP